MCHRLGQYSKLILCTTSDFMLNGPDSLVLLVWKKDQNYICVTISLFMGKHVGFNLVETYHQ